MKRQDYYLSNIEIPLLVNLNAFIEIHNCRQTTLCDAKKLSKLSKDNETSEFSEEHIRQLWQLGFINADLIISEHILDTENLILIKEDDRCYHYTDIRKLQPRKDGYCGILDELEEFPNDIKLFFHPFRCYVLYHIERTLKQGVHTMVYLKNHDGFNIIHNQLTEAKIQWLATESTIDLFFYWNYITFISILLEPPTHSIIHQKITITHKTIEDTEKAIMQLHHESKTVLQQIGIEKLQYFRDEICRDADRLDKNRKLHLIIRLMNDQSRKYITGKIAGAVLFKEQVEIYRRHIEEVFETKIPEEDECGFASVNTKYKLEAHGSYRLLDGERIVVNQFIRGLGLDYGIRVNVYVEGDTEYYAIKTEFEKTNHVNIINLKGAFAESRGKGLSFRENLRNDKNSKIFSVIVFDNDVSDNVRAMKKAIEDDEVVGRFFISKPDFEFENFSLEELSDIVITLSHEYGIDIDENSKFLELIGEVRSGEEFKKVITQYSNDLGRLIKGKIWGEALAIYANEHYEDFQERTIIKIFHMISACKSYSYELSKKVKINPETGNFEC